MDAGTRNLILAGAFVAGGYLCGSIPFGLLVGKLKGVDVREHGSGNIGATNVGRVVGKPFGYLVFILDFLKGLLPVAFAGKLLVHGEKACTGCGASLYLIWVAIAAACVLGHVFPIYLNFKGGKGVATSAGVMLGIYPYFTLPGIIVLALWLAVARVWRYVSLASMAAAVAFPMTFMIVSMLNNGKWPGLSELWPLHALGVAIAVMVVYRHRANISRLLAGTESKIGGSRPQAM